MSLTSYGCKRWLGKAKQELAAGILNSSLHVYTRCEEGYHTVKCLSSDSEEQSCFP